MHINYERIKRIKQQYHSGDRVELLSMFDESDMPTGLTGTVQAVDDMGQLLMSWDNGRSLSLIPGKDSFRVLPAAQEADLIDGLPEMCFSVLPSSGELICIRRGEAGYNTSQWNTGNAEKNRKIADHNNRGLGVTSAQEQAMMVGSMAGWHTKGADPATYENQGPAMGL